MLAAAYVVAVAALVADVTAALGHSSSATTVE